MSELSFEVSRFERPRRYLIESHPDIDDEAMFDTLEGATNFNEAVGVIVRSAVEDDRSKLLDALKGGADVPGAVLSNIQNTPSARTK